MEQLKLNIQMFADGKVVIETELDNKGLKSGLNDASKSVNSAGSTIKGIVAGLGITKLVSVAMNQITGSIDSAVARVDTLNNFPKVMSNLGIGSKEAEKSIKKMSKKLSGLPTTLDQAASAVQRFTSSNNDVRKSTDMFLALNNAILAGGASSEIQASALEQLSQSYAKGKPDMMEWRTAMTAMPAQLKQVAQAMGYVSADALGEALREGTVSMDEFMDTITKLNTEGVDGFQSFEKQARNSTGGIGTAITVAKTQVVKGVADMIEGLNKGLQDADLPSIGEMISTIGKKAKEVLDKIAKRLPGIINFMVEASNILSKILPFIAPIIAGILTYISVMKTMQLITMAVTIAQNLLNAAMLMNPIGLVIAGIMALIVAFVLLWNKCEGFRNFWKSLWEGIVDIIKHPFEYIGYVVGFIIGSFVRLGSNLYTFATVTIPNIVKNIINWFKQLPQKVVNVANGIKNAFTNLPGKMLNIGKNIVQGIWNGIKGAGSWIKDKIKDFANGLVKGIKDALKIHSPSRVMRDEVGKFMAQGIGVGFEDELSSVYGSMQRAINMEQAKLQANVETGKVFNSLSNQTPIEINLNGDVEMDGQKVGRMVTPTVAKTMKSGGIY